MPILVLMVTCCCSSPCADRWDREDWKMWAEDVKNKMGFLEWNTHDNPVIWSEVTGRWAVQVHDLSLLRIALMTAVVVCRYIGGCVEFRRWVENHFGSVSKNCRVSSSFAVSGVQGRLTGSQSME
eukprot:767777-Hanusia_phi.AAC.6